MPDSRPCIDDPTIGSDQTLWRRVRTIVDDPNLATGRRPSTGDFDDTSPTDPMSATWVEYHLNLNFTFDDFVSRWPELGVVSVPVALVRQAGLAVMKDPTPEDPAHVLVCGDKTKGTKKKLAKGATILRDVPPPANELIPVAHHLE